MTEITWTDCAEKMPTDDFKIMLIAREHTDKLSESIEVMYVVPAAIMCRYYDEHMLEFHSYTEFTEEKWEYLNK